MSAMSELDTEIFLRTGYHAWELPTSSLPPMPEPYEPEEV